MKTQDIRLTDRLYFRQALLAMTAAIGMWGIFAILQIGEDLAAEKFRVSVVGTNILRPVSGSMSRAAYRLDQVAAQELSSGLLEEPSVISVRIIDDFGETLANAERPRPDQSRSLFAFLLSDAPVETVEELFVQPENLHVGRVTVVIDPDTAAQPFFRRTTLTLLSGLAATLALTLVLTGLFYAVVTRRIVRMAEGFRTDDGAVAPVPKGDELAFLDRAIQRWRDDRDAATQDLASAAERMRLAERVAKFGIWEWTSHDNALRWDSGMHDLYGTAPETFHSTEATWSAYIHPDDRDRVLASVRFALARSDTLNHVYRIRRDDGTMIDVHAVARVERDAHDQPVRMTGINMDVTEERALLAEVEAGQRVEALGALSAGVAHDFNNVLAVIMGNLELARDTIDPAEAQDYNATALHACTQGKALTQQLLAFGRSAQLQPRFCDLNEVVRNLLPMLQRTIPASIKIETALDPALPKVLVDPGLLESALLNLVINARDAMKDGGRIQFSTKVFDVGPEEAARHFPGRYVQIVVEDNGSGIAPEHVARVFDPFFSTKGFGKGHGMGLSMVRGFAEQSGGNVNVRSEIGRGTAFLLDFPSAAAEGAADTEAKKVERNSALERKTVLVVEDNIDVRRMTVLQLKHLGHATIEAGTAREGLSVLASGAHVDLVLTDAVMPGSLQGVDLARKLVERAGSPPVIMISGYDGRSVGNGPDETSVFEIIQKPVSIRDLQSALERALS